MNLGAACNRARPYPYQNGIAIYLKVMKHSGYYRISCRVKISVFEIVTYDTIRLNTIIYRKIN